MTTGERIKQARQAVGMTQADLAKLLDVPFQSISQWERGVRNPKYSTLQRIAEALGVSADSLMENGHVLTSSVELAEPIATYEALTKVILEDSKVPAHIKAMIQKFRPNQEEVKNALFLLSSTAFQAARKITPLLEKLNDKGQLEAKKRIEELAQLPQYQAAPQDGGEADALDTEKDE